MVDYLVLAVIAIGTVMLVAFLIDEEWKRR